MGNLGAFIGPQKNTGVSRPTGVSRAQDTSARHLGAEAQVRVSVNGPARSAGQSDAYTNRQDDIRYQNRLAHAKLEKEKAAAQQPVDKDAFEVALGGGYKLKGRYGIEKNLQKYMIDRKGNYRNLTEADKQVLLKTMDATLKQKRTGQEISRFDMRKMRNTLWGEKKSGTISGGVYNQYKNLIDKIKGK